MRCGQVVGPFVQLDQQPLGTVAVGVEGQRPPGLFHRRADVADRGFRPGQMLPGVGRGEPQPVPFGYNSFRRAVFRQQVPAVAAQRLAQARPFGRRVARQPRRLGAGQPLLEDEQVTAAPVGQGQRVRVTKPAGCQYSACPVTWDDRRGAVVRHDGQPCPCACSCLGLRLAGLARPLVSVRER